MCTYNTHRAATIDLFGFCRFLTILCSLVWVKKLLANKISVFRIFWHVHSSPQMLTYQIVQSNTCRKNPNFYATSLLAMAEQRTSSIWAFSQTMSVKKKKCLHLLTSILWNDSVCSKWMIAMDFPKMLLFCTIIQTLGVCLFDMHVASHQNGSHDLLWITVSIKTECTKEILPTRQIDLPLPQFKNANVWAKNMQTSKRNIIVSPQRELLCSSEWDQYNRFEHNFVCF